MFVSTPIIFARIALLIVDTGTVALVPQAGHFGVNFQYALLTTSPLYCVSGSSDGVLIENTWPVSHNLSSLIDLTSYEPCSRVNGISSGV